MPRIVLEHVTVVRGGRRILHDFNLDIRDGEYFALVGETGAGKTTILNLINGLLIPDEGRVIIDGKDVTRSPAETRDVGMVFENYALFPHYNVYKNVTYSHRVKDRDIIETKKTAREVLSLVLIPNRDRALPKELSGGMQQRVALARALMCESGILLFDDPFSALDAGLRMSLRIELKNLARELGTTVVHCTNDVEEAMMVCDRMAIMRNGQIIQLGTPDDIYYRPCDMYVASFIGDVNLFKCKVIEREPAQGLYVLKYQRGKEAESREFRVIPQEGAPVFKEGEDVLLCVRAEHFYINHGYRKKPNRVHGTIDEISFLGHVIRYEVKDEYGRRYRIQRFVNAKTKYMKFQKGETVTLGFHHKLGLLFKCQGEEEQLCRLENI
ncbi:MAG: ABC transporter ATP-binding protein [Candidatus Sigynarchaeota archaeon]